MQRYFKVVSLLALLFTSMTAFPASLSEARQYTFAWMFSDDSEMKPRGGNTLGPSVELERSTSVEWQSLQEKGLSKFERDRRAILAMQGPYRTSFDFIETEGYVPGYTPQKPYQSWGTEYVYLLKDSGDFISLQHILVMQIKAEDGSLSEPYVVKHWRQDWAYEAKSVHTYRGADTWKKQKLQGTGYWAQSVFQVDDSPRYAASGKWQHHAGYSSWLSAETWRPLPRREFSIRQDYDALVGTNRHTITPNGWVQAESNIKMVLSELGDPGHEQAVLAREIGLNRYERIVGYDFSAGDAYWQRTSGFWQVVRQGWVGIYSREKSFTVRRKINDQLLFQAMFGYASGIRSSESFDKAAAARFVNKTLNEFLQAPSK